jgi:hypothetical protein
MAVKSNEVSLANTKVATKNTNCKRSKNERYPNLKISGQYQHLTKATINLKLNNNGTSPQETPVVDQLILGQANATLPVFAGFKIQNSIVALDNIYQAEAANAMQTERSSHASYYYARLYKAQNSRVTKENQKSTKQRVTDFTLL